MNTGYLVYNPVNDRIAIFSDDELMSDGLHCGECMEVYLDGKWKPTRIELGWDPEEWYLVGTGLAGRDLLGLKVRR